MKTVLRIIGGTMLVLLGAAAAAATGLSERDRAAIEALEQRVVRLPGPQARPGVATLLERMAETRVPAVSVAFIAGGRIRWARAYGEARAGSGQRITAATRFQAASLSKAVTAAAALRLVDRGRLALDEDVNLRLRGWRAPAWPGSTTPITLRHLLSHTAGLSVSGYPGYRAAAPVPTIVQSLGGSAPANTAAVRAFAAPGQTAYSGGGYSVAQLLMAGPESADFARLMAATLLRPAGMRQSGFDQPLSAAGWRTAASGHGADGTPVPGGAAIHPELAAAGLWTTPSDYGRFLIALQDSWNGRPGALLRQATARTMTTAVGADYALGVVAVQRRGRTIITHGGWNAGFQSRFVAFLDGSRQGLVVMTNGDNGGALAAAIQRTVAEAYGWDDTSVPPTPRAPDS